MTLSLTLATGTGILHDIHVHEKFHYEAEGGERDQRDQAEMGVSEGRDCGREGRYEGD